MTDTQLLSLIPELRPLATGFGQSRRPAVPGLLCWMLSGQDIHLPT